MKKYLPIMLAVSVGIGAWVIFLLLLPWVTYSRVYMVTDGMILVAASATIYLAWRARGSGSVMHSARSRYLLLQGFGLFAIGIAWLFIAHHFLLRK